MRVIFFIICFFIFFGCKTEKADPEQKKAEDFSEFLEFYDQFHADSAFQVAHIQFPLPGAPATSDSIVGAGDNNFRWERDSWVLHRKFDQSSGFKVQITEPFKDLIEEQIIHNSGTFKMVRRWSKSNGEWNLIYYSDLERIK